MGRKVSGRRNMEELVCLWVCVWLVIKLGLCVGNVCWLLGTDQWNVKDRESSRCCEGPTLSAFKEPESLISAEASIFQAVRDTFAFYNSYFRVRFASFLQEDSYYEKWNAERFLNVSTVLYHCKIVLSKNIV